MERHIANFISNWKFTARHNQQPNETIIENVFNKFTLRHPLLTSIRF